MSSLAIGQVLSSVPSPLYRFCSIPSWADYTLISSNIVKGYADGSDISNLKGFSCFIPTETPNGWPLSTLSKGTFKISTSLTLHPIWRAFYKNDIWLRIMNTKRKWVRAQHFLIFPSENVSLDTFQREAEGNGNNNFLSFDQAVRGDPNFEQFTERDVECDGERITDRRVYDMQRLLGWELLENCLNSHWAQTYNLYFWVVETKPTFDILFRDYPEYGKLLFEFLADTRYCDSRAFHVGSLLDQIEARTGLDRDDRDDGNAWDDMSEEDEEFPQDKAAAGATYLDGEVF